MKLLRISQLNVIIHSTHCDKHFVLADLVWSCAGHFLECRGQVYALLLDCDSGDLSQLFHYLSILIAQWSNSGLNLLSHCIYQMRTCVILLAKLFILRIHRSSVEHLQKIFEADGIVEACSILLHYAQDLRWRQDIFSDLKQNIDEIFFRQDPLSVLIQTSELIFKHLFEILGGVVELFHCEQGLWVAEQGLLFSTRTRIKFSIARTESLTSFRNRLCSWISSRHPFQTWPPKVMASLSNQICRWLLIGVIHTDMPEVTAHVDRILRCRGPPS